MIPVSYRSITTPRSPWGLRGFTILQHSLLSMCYCLRKAVSSRLLLSGRLPHGTGRGEGGSELEALNLIQWAINSSLCLHCTSWGEFVKTTKPTQNRAKLVCIFDLKTIRSIFDKLFLISFWISHIILINCSLHTIVIEPLQVVIVGTGKCVATIIFRKIFTIT